MRSDRRSNSSGQALPLMVILTPGVLALMALGVDGANFFFERRDAQDAADLAAVSGAKLLQGAGTLAEKSMAEAKARAIGIANGYAVADVYPTAHYNGDTELIEVRIETQVPTHFMPILNFFGVGDFSNWNVDARAVAQAEPPVGTSRDDATVALQTDDTEDDLTSLAWQGNNNTVTGAFIAQRVEWTGENNDLIGTGGVVAGGPPTIAIIE